MIERRGERGGVVGFEVLRVQQRLARQPRRRVADLRDLGRRGEDGQGVGAADEAVAALDFENAVEDEVDDVAQLFGVGMEGAVERRRRRQGP